MSKKILMPTILGGAARVVDDGHGLTIDEYAGNVSTNDDRISIAHVKIASATSEPWLTLDYDEVCYWPKLRACTCHTLQQRKPLTPICCGSGCASSRGGWFCSTMMAALSWR